MLLRQIMLFYLCHSLGRKQGWNDGNSANYVSLNAFPNCSINDSNLIKNWPIEYSPHIRLWLISFLQLKDYYNFKSELIENGAGEVKIKYLEDFLKTWKRFLKNCPKRLLKRKTGKRGRIIILHKLSFYI